MAIIPISVRETHSQDKKILEWYKSLANSEKSREIRKALLNYIEKNTEYYEKNSCDNNSGEVNTPKVSEVKLEKVKLTKNIAKEEDLDNKLDNLF